MAKTKLVSDAVTRSQNEFKGIVIVSSPDALDFANEINEIILKGNRWDFMTKGSSVVGTTSGTQDYAITSFASDVLWLKEAWLQDDSSTLNPKVNLNIKDSLPESALRGKPRDISIDLATQVRLFPVPSQTRSGTGMWAVSFEYYKQPIRLTATANTFEFDDMYFEVYTAGFIARVGQFLNDERAGQWLGRDATGFFRGTGLWGKFAAMLNEAVVSENRESGSPIFAPYSSLSLG